MSVCSVLRSSQEASFKVADRQLHQLLTNHLSKALGTMFRLGGGELQVASNLEALHRVPGAILLLDKNGRVIFMNGAAGTLANAANGLEIAASAHEKSGNVLLDDARAQREWRLALTQSVILEPGIAADHFSKGIAARKKAGFGEYVLQLARLPMDNGYSSPSRHAQFILFVSDTQAEHHVLDCETLARAYGLTATEIAVAQALLNSAGSEEIAEQLGIALSTVRSHLRSIYDKTRLSSQAQLIKFLLSFAGPGKAKATSE